MIKNLFVSMLLLSSLLVVSCSKKDEDTEKQDVFTFDAGGKHYDYSADVWGFDNASKTYTIKANLNDTAYVLVVIPSLKTGTYTSTNKDDASITFYNGSRIWYDSDWGTQKSFTIQITSVTDDYVEGTFSGKLGSWATYLGTASTYLEISNGTFGFSR